MGTGQGRGQADNYGRADDGSTKWTEEEGVADEGMIHGGDRGADDTRWLTDGGKAGGRESRQSRVMQSNWGEKAQMSIQKAAVKLPHS